MVRAEIIIIEGWMTRELKLGGNNLLVYALIYNFSKDVESAFYGNYDYIMEHTGIESRKTVTNVLKHLETCNYIEKIDRYSTTGKSNGYKVKFSGGDIFNPTKEKKPLEEPKNELKKEVKTPRSKIKVDENGLTVFAKMALGMTPIPEEYKNSLDLVDIEDEDIVVNEELEDNSKVHKLESYDEVLDSCGVTNPLERGAYFEFIRHCHLNKKLVTNDKLYRLVVNLDLHYQNNVNAKIRALHEAIDKGFYTIVFY